MKGAEEEVAGERGLDGDVGGLLANVNRWRDQIGLSPIGPDGLQRDTRPIQVDGLEAQWVTLIGANQAILGAIVPRGDHTYFFKMKGAPELIATERATMLAFLESDVYEYAERRDYPAADCTSHPAPVPSTFESKSSHQPCSVRSPSFLTMSPKVWLHDVLP